MTAYGSGPYGAGIYAGTTWEEQMAAFNAGPILLVEIDFPTGMRRFSQTTVRFLSNLYKGRIIGAGSFRRAIQQNLGLFEIASIETVFADVDRVLVDLTTSDSVKGVVSRFKLGTKKLPLSEFQTIFEGKIDDFGGQNYQFRVLVRDKLWTMPPKPNTGYVTLDEFPNALPADVGKPLPVCYGFHSDTGSAGNPNQVDFKNRGAWPALYVDVTSGSRTFLLAGHAIKDIAEVYAYKPTAGSQLLTETTDYVAYPNGFLGSRRCAFVVLTATGFAKLIDTNALGELTANVEGKTLNEDGTGDLLENPILVIKDILSNYLGSPGINGDKFSQAEAVADNRSYVCAGGYIEEKQTDEFFQELCDSFSIRIFPDRNGKIAVNIFDPISPFTQGLKMREQWEILQGSWQVDYLSDIQGAEDSQIVNSVDYKYSYHWAKKHFRGSDTILSESSITTYGVKKLVLEMLWARDSTTGSDVTQRIVTLYRNPVAHAQVRAPMMGMNIELTDVISVTHGDGPDGGYQSHAFELIETTFDPNDFSVLLRAKDVGAIAGQAFFMDDEELRQISEGTAQVVNASTSIALSVGTTAGVSVGDIIRLKNPTNEGNRLSLKITEIIDSSHVRTSQSVWTNESSIPYDIIHSWITRTGDQMFGGHMCDETTGEFSNGNAGLVLS